MLQTIFTMFKPSRVVDADIRRWAEIEYKKDSDFAYNHMIQYGIMPDLKLNR